MALSERLNTPISTAELERRWKAVRAAMAAAKIDVLLMQNNNDHMGGYVRYFTDMPATNGYPQTVVFPRDDEMTVVCQGPFGGDRRPPDDPQVWRGVKRLLNTPSYASAHYTKEYDPELAAKGLAPFAKGTIGYVGTYQMSFALLDYMKRTFPQANFVDATRDGRQDQGHQEPGGDGTGQARRGDAGRRHAGGLRRDQAGHARRRGRGHRAGLQRGARQRERHLSLRLDAARQGPAVRTPPSAGAHHPGRRPVRAAGRGQRPGRHVHRARTVLRGRQGAAADEGRTCSSASRRASSPSTC